MVGFNLKESFWAPHDHAVITVGMYTCDSGNGDWGERTVVYIVMSIVWMCRENLCLLSLALNKILLEVILPECVQI